MVACSRKWCCEQLMETDSEEATSNVNRCAGKARIEETGEEQRTGIA